MTRLFSGFWRRVSDRKSSRHVLKGRPSRARSGTGSGSAFIQNRVFVVPLSDTERHRTGVGGSFPFPQAHYAGGQTSQGLDGFSAMLAQLEAPAGKAIRYHAKCPSCGKLNKGYPETNVCTSCSTPLQMPLF